MMFSRKEEQMSLQCVLNALQPKAVSWQTILYWLEKRWSVWAILNRNNGRISRNGTLTKWKVYCSLIIYEVFLLSAVRWGGISNDVRHPPTHTAPDCWLTEGMTQYRVASIMGFTLCTRRLGWSCSSLDAYKLIDHWVESDTPDNAYLFCYLRVLLSLGPFFLFTVGRALPVVNLEYWHLFGALLWGSTCVS